ncbi:MAG: hypothetical protein J3R72DRAFT_450704 [Linnemannia gamsii]|nr:MAG: hypothetical protein J3R72DRAFT_450704 [Linnemannia gamsii]
MVTRKDERLPELSPAELNPLQQYNRPPKALHEILFHGCSSVGEALEEKPSKEFQIVAHDCITQVLRNYQRHGYAFPQEPSEALFNHHLWGFLPFALSCFPLFDYKPGEISSESSAQRRRKQHAWDSRQFMGHKVDGVVVISKRPVEICWMEAAKKYGGVNTTKCLHDTRKLMKLMKDGHDMIRQKAEQYIRHRLVTFALRISGPSVSIVTLHQRPGRSIRQLRRRQNHSHLLGSTRKTQHRFLPSSRGSSSCERPSRPRQHPSTLGPSRPLASRGLRTKTG